MKKIQSDFIKRSAVILLLLVSVVTSGFAQQKYHTQSIDIKVSGTSSLHDWEMISDKGEFSAAITMSGSKVAFSGLRFSVPAESLKSGHGKMDKNTYKALNTAKNPNISFVLLSGAVQATRENTYELKGIGNLTIAGKTVETDLVVVLVYNPADKTFSCSGTKKFRMTEYGVKPPTVMMGAIKTGDEISISYTLTIKS
jgi:polyisoprenoid-binding protein YceI